MPRELEKTLGRWQKTDKEHRSLNCRILSCRKIYSIIYIVTSSVCRMDNERLVWRPNTEKCCTLLCKEIIGRTKQFAGLNYLPRGGGFQENRAKLNSC